jgi:hypothetical protein
VTLLAVMNLTIGAMMRSANGWAGAAGRIRWLSAIVLCALVGVLWTAGSASAASRGFVIHNYTARDLRVSAPTSVRADPGVFYHFGFEGRPKDGAVLAAHHGIQDWQLKYQFGRSYAARVLYKMPVSTEKCRWMAIEFCRSTWESDGGLIRG